MEEGSRAVFEGEGEGEGEGEPRLEGRSERRDKPWVDDALWLPTGKAETTMAGASNVPTCPVLPVYLTASGFCSKRLHLREQAPVTVLCSTTSHLCNLNRAACSQEFKVWPRPAGQPAQGINHDHLT